MRNLLLAFVLGVITGAILMTSSSKAQSQAPPPMFFAVGSGWQTCSDWKDVDGGFQIGYVIGHADTAAQFVQLLGGIPDARQIRESFDVRGIKFGDEKKALDTFCGDYRNLRIPLVNALAIVTADLSGRPAEDEKNLRSIRCIAVAGSDVDKIRACEHQQ